MILSKSCDRGTYNSCAAAQPRSGELSVAEVRAAEGNDEVAALPASGPKNSQRQDRKGVMTQENTTQRVLIQETRPKRS